MNVADHIIDVKNKVEYHVSRIRSELNSLEYILQELHELAAMVPPKES